MTYLGMNIGQWISFAVKTPAEAANLLIVQNMPRDVLWTALALTCVLNSILFSLILALTPPVPSGLEEPDLMMPAFINSPLMFFVIVAGILVIMTHVLHWVGTAFGGTGSLADLLSVFVGMQTLSVIARSGSVVLMLIAPPAAALYGLAVMGLSIWVSVNFINQGVGLGSVWKTAGLLAVVACGLVFGMSVFLTVVKVALVGIE